MWTPAFYSDGKGLTVRCECDVRSLRLNRESAYPSLNRKALYFRKRQTGVEQRKALWPCTCSRPQPQGSIKYLPFHRFLPLSRPQPATCHRLDVPHLIVLTLYSGAISTNIYTCRAYHAVPYVLRKVPKRAGQGSPGTVANARDHAPPHFLKTVPPPCT